MGKLYAELDARLRAFLSDQHVFFVGTAPLAGDGHVNVSPKSADCFAVLGPTRVGYLDLTGSGAETIAHARENGRICLMFCALEGPPKIVRLHGRARVVEPHDAGWPALAGHFPERLGARAIIEVELDRISDSCGYGIPLYEYRAERTQLREWAERKSSEGLARYRDEHNAQSIDGLPALTRSSS